MQGFLDYNLKKSYCLALLSLGWWNGRHWGLKIPWGQPRAGSTPVPSIPYLTIVT